MTAGRPDGFAGVGTMLSFYLAALESGGDRKIFAEIYQRYHVKMERTAMNILKGSERGGGRRSECLYAGDPAF